MNVSSSARHESPALSLPDALPIYIASFGKNHQGWHFGFKLHASITLDGRLSGLALTPASMYDAQMIPKILNRDRKSTRLNSSHVKISYAVFCLKKKRTLTMHMSGH